MSLAVAIQMDPIDTINIDADSTFALALEAQGNPYQGIIDRNVFALKPAPRPEDNPIPETPPPKIVLQGLNNIFGKKQVMFKTLMSYGCLHSLPPKRMRGLWSSL